MMNKVPLFMYFCACILFACAAKEMNPTISTTTTYLALGDSYTIGEGVSAQESFPYQTVSLLNKAGLSVSTPTVVAKTGWTTDELEDGIAKATLDKTYGMVSLLIGVNNQYRGRSTEEYATQFEGLLQKAIAFAGGNTAHVFVVSIPDWGVTPFAEGRDRAQIAREIDQFNAINRSIAARYKVAYVDITPGSRDAANDSSLVTTDHLHPTGKEYGKWAAKLAPVVQQAIGKP